MCFLVLLIFRTTVPMFNCRKFPNTKEMKAFRAFYGTLWISTVLNSALYWVLFAEQANENYDPIDPEEDPEAAGLKSVILIFIPTIIMSLDYTLLYLQLEEMNKGARSQGGVAYIKKEYHMKLTKIMNIVTFVYVGIFIAVQALIIVLTVVGTVKPQAFLVELNTLILFLMIFLNIFALVNYCRNAGNPYLNAKFKKYVRKYKFVVVMWNVGFIIKFIMSSAGAALFDLDATGQPSDDFWYSVETFVNIMFSEIMPFYLVLDTKIIKIFTLKFLMIEERELVGSISPLETS